MQYLIQIFFLSHPIIAMLLSEVNFGPDPASENAMGILHPLLCLSHTLV